MELSGEERELEFVRVSWTLHWFVRNVLAHVAAVRVILSDQRERASQNRRMARDGRHPLHDSTNV